MPCESCHQQFTVFRRKRVCHDCRCFYCSNCLTTTSTRRNCFLCRRCAIFAKRPLSRSDLQHLKPKDLIFYLQSKHISTAGCVEKEELVCLVLSHIERQGGTNSTNSTNQNDQSSPEGGESSHSFDSLKQSCQNFFSNLSDNISDSFAAFEPKSSSKYPNHRDNNRQTSPHIYEQPRVRTREIPTYISAQNTTQTSHTTGGGSQQPSSNVHNEYNTSNTATRSESPLVSHRSESSSTSPKSSSIQQICSKTTVPTTSTTTQQLLDNEKSDCDCSDDEIITTFSERVSLKTDNSGGPTTLSRPTPTVEQTISGGLGPSTSTTTTTTGTSPGYSKHDSLSSKVDNCGVEISSQSSFEELGAIGGISDESKAATDTNSNSNVDQWQILDATGIGENLPLNSSESPVTDEIIKVILRDDSQDLSQSIQKQQQQQNVKPPPVVPQRTKKVIRRRSDGYLNNRRNHSSDDESPIESGGLHLATLGEQVEQHAIKNNHSCQRCGKNKTNIRRHVERMRRHLESSQMSEEDIKLELQEFLTYLEQRTKSIDCSDPESRAVSSLSGGGGMISGGGGGDNASAILTLATPTIEFSPTPEMGYMDDNEGIHVYGAPVGYEAANTGFDSRFINLDDFEDFKELENLTVKQLKEVLMLHRVDYKGCCEKQELLDRVRRLWKNLRTAPAVEKLATDELCKICMDAPIECVFLECGHMATCTNCGKVLNECPICRQYIVRVVRFFRA